MKFLGREGVGPTHSNGYLFYETRFEAGDQMNYLKKGDAWWTRTVWFMSDGVSPPDITNVAMHVDGSWPSSFVSSNSSALGPCFCF